MPEIKHRQRTNNWTISNGKIRIKVCNLSQFFRSLFNEETWKDEYFHALNMIHHSEKRECTLENGLTIVSNLHDEESIKTLRNMLEVEAPESIKIEAPVKITKKRSSIPAWHDRFTGRPCLN